MAGVSSATVSRVLNTPTVVTPATRQRVEQVIEELGFMRSPAARAINSGRSRILGALIPTLESDIFSITVNAIQNRLVTLGYSLIVATTEDDMDQEAQKAQELLDVGVEGLVLTGVTHSDALYALLAKARIPAVVTSYFDPAFRLPTVGYDNRLAVELALSHLTTLGHRHVAVVHGPAAGNDRTLARLDAVPQGGNGPHVAFFETRLSVGGGARAARQVLGAPERFDALFCLSDVLAFGALNELQRSGIKVPEALSVIGIHDLPASRHTYPRLTTVHLPAQEMGEAAAESLAKWVETGERPEAVYFPSTLVERETTARR